MTDKVEETKEIVSEVKKSEVEPSLTSIVAELLKNQEARINTFEKRFDDLTTLIKEHNANPVDSGVEAENKPKTEDANDVGDKVTVGNEVAPVPSDSQASIIAPALEDSKPDDDGLKMEQKADGEKKDEEKKEEKKEEVTKMDDHDEKKPDEKKEEVKKSDDSEYEFVKTVRPILKGIQFDAEKTVPTGYQVLKSIVSGWGGKTSSIEEALTIAYSKLDAGEFGNGLPQGVY